MFTLHITETLNSPDGLQLEVERLKMTVDGPVDVMPIIALLQKKPSATRRDAGTKRNVSLQQ